MSDKWDNVGYVRSSQYREGVARHLYDEGPAMPSEIAAATGHDLPHVSRALAELRERDVVELLVSEQRHRGRVYGLTDEGTAVAVHLHGGVGPDEWSVVDREDFAEADLLGFLEDELAGALQAVGLRTASSAEVVLVGTEEAADLVFESAVPALVRDPETGVEGTPLRRYAVDGFEDATVVRLCGESGVGVSIDPSLDVGVPGFVERCYRALG